MAGYDVLGLRRLDFFPGRRSAARRAGLAEFSVFPRQRDPGFRDRDALDRCRARLGPLVELPRHFLDLVAPPARSGLRGRIRLRLRSRAFIYPAALRAVHLFPILTQQTRSNGVMEYCAIPLLHYSNTPFLSHEKENHRRKLEDEHDPGR